jgi:maleylacetoacetate isomerase/maleylpyruvate isomerase
MKLYTFFRSSAAYRLRIALNLKGIDYESAFVSLPKMEHVEADFAAVNPQRRVPALEDGGKVFIQSMAIIEYLDETHVEPPLMPTGAEDRAYVRALSQVISCDIHPLNNVAILKYLENVLGHDAEARQAWYEHWIAEGFTALEALLGESGLAGRFCYRDQVTLADVCLVPQVYNAQRFNCPTGAYPRLMAIFDNCMSLKPFADAAPENQADKT